MKIAYSVFKPKGKTNYAVEFKDPSSGRTRRLSAKTPVKREADRFAVELVTEYSQPGSEARGEGLGLEPLLLEWERGLESSGRSLTHIEATTRRARALLAIPGLTTTEELEAWADIEGALMELSQHSVSTQKAYIQSAKQFASWLARRGKLSGRTPLLNFRAKNAREGDQRHAHDLPTDEDVRLLMNLPDDLQDRCHLTSSQRKLMYTIMACTGARLKECQALTKKSFSSRGLRLPAGATKNRKAAYLMLPPWLLKEVNEYCNNLPTQSSRLFETPGRIKGAEIIRKDLEAMGSDLSKYENIMSPHSLRVWFCTRLARNPDVSFRQVMELARHSNPELTAKIYARAGKPELKAAIDSTFSDFGQRSST